MQSWLISTPDSAELYTKTPASPTVSIVLSSLSCYFQLPTPRSQTSHTLTPLLLTAKLSTNGVFEDGVYLVRQRPGYPADYVLSLNFKGKPTHHLVALDPATNTFLVNKKTYGSPKSIEEVRSAAWVGGCQRSMYDSCATISLRTARPVANGGYTAARLAGAPDAMCQERRGFARRCSCTGARPSTSACASVCASVDSCTTSCASVDSCASPCSSTN